MNVVKKINSLPDDVIYIIFEYIPKKNLIFIDSLHYNLYHHLIRPSIKLYESYIRDMIKRDNYYVFNRLLRDNVDNWIKHRQYIYRDMVFSNYIYFVLHFCSENNSHMCRNILIEELSKRNLWINLHKKNIVKYIKWRI